jgi:hypothetical protein
MCEISKLCITTAEGAWPVTALETGEILPVSEPLKLKRLSDVWPTVNTKGPIGWPMCGPWVLSPQLVNNREKTKRTEIRIAFIAAPYDHH